MIHIHRLFIFVCDYCQQKYKTSIAINVIDFTVAGFCFVFFVGKNFLGNLSTEVLRKERQNKIFICRFIFSFLYAFYSSCSVFTGSIHVRCKKGFDSSSLFHCPSLSFTPYQQQALFCHKNKTRYMTCFHVYDFTICK